MTAPEILPAGDPDALDAAVVALLAGGIVGMPTETVYGLAVLPLAEPLEALVRAKRRPAEKGIALLIDGLDQVDLLVLVGATAQRLAAQFWPGPLTLALPLRAGVDLPEGLTGGRRTVGVRVPDHPVPRAIARRLGPIAVSSANISGMPEARTAAGLVEAVGDSITLVLDGGPVRGLATSTVIGFTEDDAPLFFRVGALTEDDIRAALQPS
jgi:L-threonylcarbamoyladenylate synthase